MTSRMHCAPALALLVAASLASPCRAGSTIIGSPINAGGYTFTNFDFSPLTGTATGSNVNGISNSGQVTGTTVDVNGAPTFTNFSGNPLTGTLNQLNTGAGQTAFGIDTKGDVVGGNGTNAFFLPNGGSLQILTTPPGAINAFGINDKGNIVGQYTTAAGTTPGFILQGTTVTTINAPSGPNTVNAQGINNNGLIVGFYLGTDAQVHGFMANASSAVSGRLTGTPIADPIIPTVPGEPGATFVFSQVLGINDHGLAVGYYGDSTTSQHGYFYNTLTNSYTFLDDPAAMFHNGVEITQITGINNAGDIAGFYTDANGTFHSFIAVPVPEPSSMALLGIGVTSVAVWARRRRKTTAPSHQ